MGGLLGEVDNSATARIGFPFLCVNKKRPSEEKISSKYGSVRAVITSTLYFNPYNKPVMTCPGHVTMV
mgnify:CR=1 FL=1